VPRGGAGVTESTVARPLLVPRHVTHRSEAPVTARDEDPRGPRPTPGPGTPSDPRRGAPEADAPAPRQRTPEALTQRSRRALAELRRGGIPAEVLAERFPHVLNRLGEAWETPTAVLESIGELLVDRRGGRMGFPPEALNAILAVRRHCVRRIVAAAGLQAPPAAGLGQDGSALP
jgi:hypothetical protein